MSHDIKDNVELNPADPDIDTEVERTPTVLILDTSGSMSNRTTGTGGKSKKKIDRLNEGLELFRDEVLEKEDTATRVDVGVVEFGGEAEIRSDITNIKSWTPPTLTASGTTPMKEAIELSIDMTEDVKSFYADKAIPYTRPICWLLTDGKPDMDQGDKDWGQIQEQLNFGKEKKHFTLFAMGVSGADMKTLNQLVEPTGRPALEIKEGMFAEYFQFLSNSLEDVSQAEGEPDHVGDPGEIKRFTKMSK